MNTPAHLLIGAAVCARPLEHRIILAALVGAAIPDLSLYVMAGVALNVLKIPPERVFNELYFSDPWQQVFAIDNSLLLWGALLGLAIYAKRRWAMALCGAAVLHILCDLPLHHDDGRPHFWPVSSWVFESPVSYWDKDHGAVWIAPIEAALVFVAMLSFWIRKSPLWIRILAMVLFLFELWIVWNWLFVFVDSQP